MKSLLLIIFIFSVGSSMAETLNKCNANFEPISSLWPKYPSVNQSRKYISGTSYAHVMVEGLIKVRFTVTEKGNVKNIILKKSEYNLVGRDARFYKAGHFDGFLELNLFKTLKSWKYKSINKQCIIETSFEWRSESNTEQENANPLKKASD